MEKTQDVQSVIDMALEMGAFRAAVVSVADIVFNREFRKACETNACGKYGRNWMCPPDAGDIDELMAKAQTYTQALVFQTVGMLEDSFDIEGMEEAAVSHNALMQKLCDAVEEPLNHPLRLAAGGCHVCEKCTRPDNLPCRYPDRALASLETYGIAVSELATLAGMKYINGQNTVTFFGGFLFR